MSRYRAIVFDFDGVLVESLAVKAEAFAKLYEHGGPEIQEKVRAYHKAHGGVSRYEKIRYFEKNFMGSAPTEQKIQEMSAQFSDLVEKKVSASGWVVGAKEFLEKYYQKSPLYVASATPQAELERILAARDMADYFKGVYGSPETKDNHLRTVIVAQGCTAAEILMVGDAMSDYEAAQMTGANFIGRRTTTEFPAGTVVIRDLTELSVLL